MHVIGWTSYNRGHFQVASQFSNGIFSIKDYSGVWAETGENENFWKSSQCTASRDAAGWSYVYLA